jgi:hypothetical protein
VLSQVLYMPNHCWLRLKNNRFKQATFMTTEMSF